MVLFLVLLPILATYINRYIMDGTSVIRLNKTSALSGEISASLFNYSTSNNLSKPNFVITNTRYFDNYSWAVVNIKLVPSQNTSMVVLKQVNGAYMVEFGPGNSIPQTSLIAVPSDLVNYLEFNKLVNQSE